MEQTKTELSKLLDTLDKQDKQIKHLTTIVEHLINRGAIPDKKSLDVLNKIKLSFLE